MFAAALVFPDPVVTKSKGAKVLPSLDSSFRWFWEKNSWTSWSARFPLLEGLGVSVKTTMFELTGRFIQTEWGKSGGKKSAAVSALAHGGGSDCQMYPYASHVVPRPDGYPARAGWFPKPWLRTKHVDDFGCQNLWLTETLLESQLHV